MKILMLHGHYSDTGGAEVVINNQINGLRARGHEVLFFCFGEKNINQRNLVVVREPRSRFLRYVYQFLINPTGYIRIKKTIKSFRPDIIHLHNIDKHALTFLLPLKHYKTIRSIHDFGIVCPAFWGIHKDDRKVCEQGIGFKCIRHGCLNPCLYPLYYYLFKIKHSFQRKRVQGYITATHLMREYMENQEFRNIVVLPYFTDKRSAMAENTGKKEILFVGKLEENKGCESLIKAFGMVLEKIPDARLTLVGSGVQEINLKKLSRSMNISEKINFCGSVPNKNIAKHYIDATVVVVPSLCMDNSPIVIYEALSFGKPVIATDRGGIPELITNGYNGFLVNADHPEAMAEAIVNILGEKNGELYEIMTRHAFDSSLKYSVDKYVDNLESAYRKL